MSYSKLSKSQLIELLEETERTLSTAIVDAREAAEKYSIELPSRLAFEVGYLGGRIRNVNIFLNDSKNRKK